jgi:hypothetical protein
MTIDYSINEDFLMPGSCSIFANNTEEINCSGHRFPPALLEIYSNDAAK